MDPVTLADGTPLHVIRAGDPEAEVTVVFSHGYALDHRCWDRITGDLPGAVERPIQVVAYDQRGHGKSGEATEQTATVEQLGDDLAELIGQVAPAGAVVLVGHCMGGLTAAALSERHPSLFAADGGVLPRVAALALLSTGANHIAAEARAATGLAVESSTSAVPAVITKLMWDLEALVGPRLVDLVTDRAHKAMITSTRWSLFGEEPSAEDVLLTLRMIRHHWPLTMALFRPALDEFVREAKLTLSADLPVIGLVGERDRLVTQEQATTLLAPIAGADVITLPRAGHMLPLERAAEVLPRIVSLVHLVQRRLRDGTA